jgi:hypothetical protein
MPVVFTSRESSSAFIAFTAEARVYPLLSISAVLACFNIIFEILERVSVVDRNADVVSLNRSSLFTFCKSVVLFLRDSLPDEENPSVAAEVTRGHWRSSADDAAVVTAGTMGS